MRTIHTFGIQFIIRSNRKDQTTGIIYVRITVEGQRTELSLKKSMPTEQWNNAKGKAKGLSPEAKSFNRYLDDIRIKLNECLMN